MKFLSKFIHFHSRKCIWKCRLENVSHFVSASIRTVTRECFAWSFISLIIKSSCFLIGFQWTRVVQKHQKKVYPFFAEFKHGSGRDRKQSWRVFLAIPPFVCSSTTLSVHHSFSCICVFWPKNSCKKTHVDLHVVIKLKPILFFNSGFPQVFCFNWTSDN